MEDSRFLLTYTDNKLSCKTYGWYQSEEEMQEDILIHPEWSDFEATEILNCRAIEL